MRTEPKFINITARVATLLSAQPSIVLGRLRMAADIVGGRRSLDGCARVLGDVRRRMLARHRDMMMLLLLLLRQRRHRMVAATEIDVHVQ